MARNGLTKLQEARAAYTTAFGKATIAERTAKHERVAAEKADAMEARRELGRSYLARNPDGIVVPPGRAVAVVDLIDETAGAREESIALASDRTTSVNNGALEFPTLAHEFPADGPSIALGTTPLILAPVVRYLGMMPVLFNMFVTRAHTVEILENTAHHFHLDPEDIRSFKVFVHLTDVDDECGPLHALPADATAAVLDAVDYRGISYLTDEQVDELAGWETVVKVTGPPGTVALADTTRCLHFGGRPRAAGKPVRDMLVFQYLLPTSTLLAGQDGIERRHFFPQLGPTGDDEWDALLGHRFT